MKKIQAFLLFAVLLLMAGMPTDAMAAKKGKAKAEPQPVVEVMDAFKQQVQADPFLSDETQTRLNNEIEQYLDALLHRSDKAEYAEKNELTLFVQDQRQQLEQYRKKAPLLIENILQNYNDLDAETAVNYRKEMEAVLEQKFTTLENNVKRLDDEIQIEPAKTIADWNWKLIGAIVGALLLLIIVFAIISRSKKNKNVTPGPVTPRNNTRSNGGQGGQQQSADGGIVVRRKTATILKKQSLEDVIDNPNYMQVDAIDFCYESAVRRMYIKNSCIEDIYNLYAEDLRNPESPKEDGCMVLGRWVHDPESNEYYVSLEEIVLPGDDAVFEEYALNFGGKIKLKVLEQLRKLRRETNLQYDLTCWVHSHPGLGVFFSNSDTSVQDQLKHPQHPNFLTAIVVDILTPMQDVGIFTYRRDTTINSKSDLKKMYSLIEWHQWAQESLKTAVQRPVNAKPQEFNSVEYFNALENAKEHDDNCAGVQLSKNAVVDICMDLTGQGDDIIAMMHGFASQRGQKVEYVAEKISDKDVEPKLSLTGCFIAAPHCSIPTVRRVVANYLDRIRFVVVYTPSDGLLTTIPVINSDLCTDEQFYGEQRLEDLKTWIKQS
ncbi:MAG: hypothetical protein IJ243_07130 [Prevotella sp.]|nr:hypothetical protein [Prevotella sp.]